MVMLLVLSLLPPYEAAGRGLVASAVDADGKVLIVLSSSILVCRPAESSSEQPGTCWRQVEAVTLRLGQEGMGDGGERGQEGGVQLFGWYEHVPAPKRTNKTV